MELRLAVVNDGSRVSYGQIQQLAMQSVSYSRKCTYGAVGSDMQCGDSTAPAWTVSSNRRRQRNRTFSVKH